MRNFLYNNKELFKLGIEKFNKFVKDREILIFQAHPFRISCTPANPNFIDGIEVYNGNMRHNSKNENALAYAKKNNLKMSSGSDFHRKEDLARGGLVLPNIPEKSSSLVKMLNKNSVIDLIESD